MPEIVCESFGVNLQAGPTQWQIIWQSDIPSDRWFSDFAYSVLLNFPLGWGVVWNARKFPNPLTRALLPPKYSFRYISLRRFRFDPQLSAWLKIVGNWLWVLPREALSSFEARDSDQGTEDDMNKTASTRMVTRGSTKWRTWKEIIDSLLPWMEGKSSWVWHPHGRRGRW